MPYNPATTTVREGILSNIETTLAAIATPTYANTLGAGRVRRWNGNLMEVADFPCALVIPYEERQSDNVSQLISHEMTVAIVLGVRAEAWAQEIHKLIADVRVALTADYTRGGRALTTQVLSDEVFEATPSAPIGGAQVMVRVLYRTLYDDPTTAY